MAAVPSACPFPTLPSRLTTGTRGYVLENDPRPLNVRAAASLNANKTGEISIRSSFNVLSGPTCNEGLTWFYVSTDGITGWIAEGTNNTYFVAPLAEIEPTVAPRTAAIDIANAINALPACNQILINESFEPTAANNWYVYNSNRFDITVDSGSYEINMRRVLPIGEDSDPISWGSLQNFRFRSARVDAIIHANKWSRPQSRSGIWLRYQDEENFIAFMISSTGSYRIARFQDGYNNLVDWTRSTAIRTGDNAVNAIAVVDIVNDTFSFYINGQFITSVTDNTWADGRLAFFGSTPDQPARFMLEQLRICE